MDKCREIEPLQLRPIQHIPPAPNPFRTAIDWIPEFAGFGWVAYGAGPFVVITTTQWPEEKDEQVRIGPFFQQLLQPLQHKKDNDDYDNAEDEIRAVAWAPVIPSNGLLAMGAGECVYVYEPYSLVAGNANSVPEMPLAWRQVKALSHSSKVNAVVWTESGDGLLAAGFDVIMWSKGDSGWIPLWKSNLKQPHFLASATWSAMGLAATAADGSTCAACPWSTTPSSFMGSSKGQVIVWHWNEVSSLQEIALFHPQPVSMIQWRPSNFYCFQRQVLLTCCLDGAVRLWIEMDNGRPKLDKTNGREMTEKYTKPTFFVSAVIEVNQCLNGILGTNISVTWTREIGGASIHNRDRFEVSSFDEVSKGNNVGSCEWLLGVGPNASLAWWSLHCLDDISPPRCPRVYLWKKGTDLLPQRLKLPLIGSYLSSHACSVLTKAFIRRIGRKLSAPPSSADLFELLADNIFSWSRVEGLVSTAGLDNSLEETINTNENNRRSPCVTSEILNQGGHSGRILHMALHPVIEAGLAASLDSNGVVLIWSLSSLVEPQIEIPTFIHPAWKLSDRLPDCKISEQNKYRFLAWAPLVLKDSQSLLFLGHAQGFDCVFIRKESTIRKSTAQHEMACTIQLSVSFSQQLECIYATLLSVAPAEDCIKYSVMVLGLGKGGQVVTSWKILLYVRHDGEIPFEQLSEYYLKKGIALSKNCIAETSELCTNEINLAKEGYYISVETCLPKLVNSSDLVHVTSIAVMPTDNQVFFCQQSDNALHGPGYNSPAYNFATCHSDGVLKLWKVTDPQESLVPHCQPVEVSWNCVGLIKIPKGTARIIALANSGSKIATASSITSEDSTTINIWDAEIYLGDGNFILEDMLCFPGCVTALDWLTIGNGQLLLGVALQNEVRVYSQRRHVSDTPITQENTAKLHIWVCIASICTTYYIRDFSWGPKATLLLVSSKLVCIVSQWAYNADRKTQELNGQKSALVNLGGLSSQSQKSPKDNTEVSLSLLTNGDRKKCSSMALGEIIEQLPQHVKGSMHSLLDIADEIGGPLPVYHPSAVLHCLLRGNRKRAVASVRHLMAYVGSGISHKENNELQKPVLSIPEVDLSQYLQLGSTERCFGRELQWGVGRDFAVSSTQDAGEVSWLMRGQNSRLKDCDDLLSKSEVESFIAALEKHPRVPGITDGERIHLSALLDLLAEISSSHETAQYENLDEPARRFWMLVHFRQMSFARKMGRSATVEELTVESRTLVWACQSDCQDILLDLCLLDELSWPVMRSLGVGFWFTNVTSLRSRMEKLARAQYLKRKDPKDCALLYMALNRWNVLLGLFKLSKDEKDKPLVGFLARNFQEEKNKAAALKNAYVLKGRHQFELAVAFFLLGDDPSSAVSVCAKNLADEQLALVICRLVEGSNGPLAHNIISNHVLPIAEEKKDYWLASLLQWLLGNPMKSFQQLIQPSRMSTSTELSFQVDNPLSGLATIVDTSCLDSNIGQYCAMVAMKNSVKGRIGESKATALARWAIMKTSSAFKRTGFPIEALECLSSSTNFLLKEGFKDLSVRESHEDHFGKYEPHKTKDMGINWISGSLADKLESTYKLNLAMQYMSKLIIAHPHWGFMLPLSYKPMVDAGTENKEESQYLLLVKESDQKLSKSLSVFEQKYFIQISDIIQALANFCYHHSRHFFWRRLLHTSIYPEFQNAFEIAKSLSVIPSATESLQKATRQTFNVLACVVLACGYNISSLKEVFINYNGLRDSESDCHNCFLNLRELMYISYELKILTYYVTNEGLHSEEQQKLFKILDLLTLAVCVALAWLRRDAKTLLTLIKTTMLADKDNSLEEFNISEMYQQLYSLVDHAQQYSMVNGAAKTSNNNPRQENDKQEKSSPQLIGNDSRWRLIGVCLWGRLMSFVSKQLNKVPSADSSYHNTPLLSAPTQLSINIPSVSDSFKKADVHYWPGGINTEDFRRLLLSTLACISAGLVRQFAWYLSQNLHTTPPNPILLWLWNTDIFLKMEAQNRALGDLDGHGAMEFENDNISYSQQGIDGLVTPENSSDVCFKEVWETLVNQKEVIHLLESKGFRGFEYRNNGVNDWSHLVKELEVEDSIESSTAEIQRAIENNGANSLTSKPTSNDHSALVKEQKMACRKDKTCISFQKPKAVLRRNGELFEAICVNSCNPEQVVVASNRKGLIYLNLTTVEPYFGSLEYLWSNAEWPSNGWAGSESTPVPTFVSPGVGLGSKEGSSLGLGGATVGLGALPKSGKDLSGVTFGIPGYAGIGAMGLGWGEWEDFEGFIDPPATAENVSTRAVASHPLRPLFLVGSSNTHVYLWEFGKASAIATYGVLPAANVPPPYALASVSAVQFDRYGHRFATAALDGTVCAWQLEVGGKSNVRPTESSLVFHQHASDVAFVGASGSILAATGLSSNGHNMVIWDTLAPPATSRVSLVCHEGGARSLAVFDHDIGSGSISPLIVTGGKEGDIAVHDFRFITTGKAKRKKHTKEENMHPSSCLKDAQYTKEAFGLPRKLGDQNSNGMLWYLPKAHLGSISRISAVPGTSLFLTGSKDGDVKLWDVKTFELLCHWPKVHDKHTFLQPNSRGFGGVVRASVTDVQILPHGFLTCGGDGAVKLFQHGNEIS